MTKLKSLFLRAIAVCPVFDKHEREISVKDITRARRDDKSESTCDDIDITHVIVVPNNHTGTEFLLNRNNKKQFVQYLIEILKCQ